MGKVNDNIVKNNVAAERQTNESMRFGGSGGVKVLFVGNSITLHGVNAAIGWHNDFGMAASSIEKDYVHIVLREIEDRCGDVSYCIANVAEWERNYADFNYKDKFSAASRFAADIAVIRLGENVDRSMLDKCSFKEALSSFIKFFAHSAKKVIVTDLFWEHERLCSATAEVAEEEGYEFVSISDLGYEDENKAIGLFAHEGVALHPGDLGMKRIAERIIEKL